MGPAQILSRSGMKLGAPAGMGNSPSTSPAHWQAGVVDLQGSALEFTIPHTHFSSLRELESGGEMVLGQPQQTCWQCQAHHQAYTFKQVSRSQELTTVYPYGDPGAITYDSVSNGDLGEEYMPSLSQVTKAGQQKYPVSWTRR